MTLNRKIKKIKNAERIAAGEVVERPANVVKELIENSIDANAKEIRILIKDAGKTLIQVIDDGSGISPKELEFAFERHTSSKIRKFEDLENLHTLGFRGEALASIATVSRVEITSRTKENLKGGKLVIEGGKEKENKEVTCPVGTNIRVKDLFYNMPARRKFLKSDATELGHITDIIQRYALAYPELHFIYHHREITILNCPGGNDLKTTVFHIYGKDIAKYMETVEYSEDPSFKVHGVIGHREISKKNRSYSSIFLNNRYIKSDVIFQSIQEAYKDVIMISRYPFVILFIDLDPSQIDFNVHPKKLHIRFENEKYIHNKVYNVVRNFVEEKFIKNEDKYLSKELYDYLEKRTPEPELESVEISPDSKIQPKIVNSKEKSLKSEEFANEETFQIEKSVQINLLEENNKKVPDYKDVSVFRSDTYLRNKYIIKKDFPKLKLISYTGQLSNNVYIVLEGFNKNNDQGLYILDQHAASERVNKEYFYDLFERNIKSRQKLISPLNIEVNPSEKYFLQDNLKDIRKLGFDFNHFGGNTFVLREVPTIFGKVVNASLMEDIIADISEIGKDKSFSDVKEEIINYLACHRSIRGGEDLTLKDIRNLLLKLSETKDPYHCAHGRPILRFLSFKDLDKLFKRT